MKALNIISDYCLKSLYDSSANKTLMINTKKKVSLALLISIYLYKVKWQETLTNRTFGFHLLVRLF